MRLDRKARRYVELGLLSLVVVVVIWNWALQPPTIEPPRTQESIANRITSQEQSQPATRAQGNIFSDRVESLSSRLQDTMPRSTVLDIVNSDLPAVPTPRAFVIQRIASLSTEEVAADLGNATIAIISRLLAGGANAYCMAEIGFWAQELRAHPGILRLIEEGRIDPHRVASLIETTLAREFEKYDSLQLPYEEAFRENGPIGGDALHEEEHYDANRRYSDPIREFMRAERAINSSLYVLLNIGRLDSPKLLETWLTKNKPGAGYYGATDVKSAVPGGEYKVWLVDAYWQQPHVRNSQAAERHREIIASANITTSPPRRARGAPWMGSAPVAQSRWNAAWNKQDFILAAKGVNTDDLPTIDVLDIPKSLYVSKEAFDRVMENFHQHAREYAR